MVCVGFCFVLIKFNILLILLTKARQEGHILLLPVAVSVVIHTSGRLISIQSLSHQSAKVRFHYEANIT